MHMRSKVCFSFSLTVLLILCSGTKSNAGFVLTLDDAATVGIDVIVGDDAPVPTLTAAGPTNAVDLFPGLGTVLYAGAAGGFNVNVTTGISDNIIGPARLDLSSVNVSGAGTLEIRLTDTGFDPNGAASLISAIGGTLEANSSLVYEVYVDSNNVEFGGILVATETFTNANLNSSSFGADISEYVGSLNGPFSMTLVARLTHGNPAPGNVTSFDADARIVPEPASAVLALAALPFFGAGLLLRRRRNGCMNMAVKSS